jgi:hypothetical protein
MSKALWKYYYDVTRYNLAFSMVLTLITLKPLNGIVSLATGGMVIGLYCYKQLQHSQYYFYYNLGITRTRLICTTWLINLVLSGLLAFLFLIFNR